MIAFWIRELVGQGAVVVAAAGNDGACRPKFPGGDARSAVGRIARAVRALAVLQSRALGGRVARPARTW